MPNDRAVVDVLLQVLDRAYDRRSWHGTNLAGSLRGLDAARVAWRPAPGRHNIWELALHCAYWKYVVRRRLTGEPRGSFPLAGSDWFARPAEAGVDEREWKRDRALLAAEHHALRAAVAQLDAAMLNAPASGGERTVAELVTGAAAHDLYHAGQIQLLKRLGAAATGRRRKG